MLGEQLEVVTDDKYLGIIIQNRKWHRKLNLIHQKLSNCWILYIETSVSIPKRSRRIYIKPLSSHTLNIASGQGESILNRCPATPWNIPSAALSTGSKKNIDAL